MKITITPFLFLLIILTVAMPAHAMKPKEEEEISLSKLQILYNEDLTAIEQSEDPFKEIAARRPKYEKYRPIMLQDDSKRLAEEEKREETWHYDQKALVTGIRTRYTIPQWLHAAAALRKEKIMEHLIQAQIFSGQDYHYKYPMDYALEQADPKIIATLFDYDLIQSQITDKADCRGKNQKISDEILIHYMSRLTELKKCNPSYLLYAALYVLDEYRDDQMIKKCFFKGLLNPAMGEPSPMPVYPVDYRVGTERYNKLATALKNTTTPKEIEEAWAALPQEITFFSTFFTDESSNKECNDTQEADQYQKLLLKIYFLIKTKGNFSHGMDPKPSEKAIPESMANTIHDIIITHESRKASNHTFLCAEAILFYLFHYVSSDRKGAVAQAVKNPFTLIPLEQRQLCSDDPQFAAKYRLNKKND